MDIHFDVTGAQEVGIRFDEFPDQLYDALLHEIEQLTEELYARIEAATPARTGALRAAEHFRIIADPDRITGLVDIEGPKGSGGIYAKAGALEYGAHRSTKVGAHTMRLDHHWGLLLAAPELVMVAAYSRTPDIHEFAFERGPLAEMTPEILGGLNGAVEQTTRAANS